MKKSQRQNARERRMERRRWAHQLKKLRDIDILARRVPYDMARFIAGSERRHMQRRNVIFVRSANGDGSFYNVIHLVRLGSTTR